MPSARTCIATARLRLVAPDPDPTVGQARAVADFFARNRDHFAPWDPPLPPDDNAPEAVQGRLVTGAAAFTAGQAYRWWLALAEAPQRVVGAVSLSGLARGPFQSGNLGYSLDGGCQAAA
jgi:ribosomal-protein-alanine N-acetyltransferase